MKIKNKKYRTTIESRFWGLMVEGEENHLDCGEYRVPLSEVEVLEMSYGEALALDRQGILSRDEIQSLLDQVKS